MIEPITVVTATVNRPTLRRTVESVQAQTLQPKIHCILFQQLMERSLIDIPKPREIPLQILWLPPPQPQFVDVLDKAEQMAETPWIAMLDDDCWWEPNHLEILAKLMDETGADFVWCSTSLDDAQTGEQIGVRDDPIPGFQHIDPNEVLFRRTCRERWGGFKIEDDRNAEGVIDRGCDGRRMERWVKGGAKYAHSSEVTLHYGWRPVPEY